MTIHNINGLPGIKHPQTTENSTNNTNTSTPAAATPATNAAAAKDTVNLTSTSAQLREMEKKLATQPVVDSQRVNDIKAQIANGTFKIDPARIADKMIAIEGMITAKK